MSCLTLTSRYGHGTSSPSERDLKDALKELYLENHPSLVDADYEEHPNTWLTYGYENGKKWTVYTLDIYRDGMVLFSKMDDQDDDVPELEKRMINVNQDKAFQLWKMLSNGDVEMLMNEQWDS